MADGDGDFGHRVRAGIVGVDGLTDDGVSGHGENPKTTFQTRARALCDWIAGCAIQFGSGAIAG